MDFSIFPQCVQNFYSGIQENINEATHCIFEMEKTPGYCEYLLELLYSRPADQIASFASTSLLNFGRKYWHNSDLFLQPKDVFLSSLFHFWLNQNLRQAQNKCCKQVLQLLCTPSADRQ